MTDWQPPHPVPITALPTGIAGLDDVLGGGLPEYSFILVAGSPGTGKTTLTQQILFALATSERPALHFTLLGEPPLKLLRYQQQFAFFDPAKVDRSIHFMNLSQEVLQGDLGAVLQTIVREVERANPRLVVIDSFRTLAPAGTSPRDGGMGLPEFLQRLAIHLTTWQATTFLIGEYAEAHIPHDPVFTVADGILWLQQGIERNSVVRKLHVLKLRGQAALPGLHTMRITREGIHVFPRIMRRVIETDRPRPTERLSVGVAGLDEMLGGGVPAWDSIMVAGPAGSGKSMLGMQFMAAGLRQGEPGVIAVFEERPQQYVQRARMLSPDLEALVGRGLLEVLYLRPLDLSVDEALLEIQAAARRVKAKRLTIDSLSGFELALAPTFREDFRESLYRMVGALTGGGVTVLMTVEVAQSFTDLTFSPNLVSFLTDNLILQRYVEIDGQLQKVLAVVKMRGSQHSKELRRYDVTEGGIVMGEGLTGYHGIVTGVAQRRRIPASGGSPD
jgi:circadian clock protein KaiC